MVLVDVFEVVVASAVVVVVEVSIFVVVSFGGGGGVLRLKGRFHEIDIFWSKETRIEQPRRFELWFGLCQAVLYLLIDILTLLLAQATCLPLYRYTVAPLLTI